MNDAALLNLDEAAHDLALTPRTLRKLVERSRVRLRGIPVEGPTIRFFQSRPGAALKFRRAWLDAYIEAGTYRPDEAPILTPITTSRAVPVTTAPRSSPAISRNGLFDPAMLDL
jgi:hypothetical protein